MIAMALPHYWVWVVSISQANHDFIRSPARDRPCFCASYTYDGGGPLVCNLYNTLPILSPAAQCSRDDTIAHPTSFRVLRPKIFSRQCPEAISKNATLTLSQTSSQIHPSCPPLSPPPQDISQSAHYQVDSALTTPQGQD